MKIIKYFAGVGGCLAATLLLGVTGARAQQVTPDQPTPTQNNIVIERHTVESLNQAADALRLAQQDLSRGMQTFSFVSSEMSFDNKLVKGAPYSAEAITETTQTLADGNRIVHQNTSNIYRDGEGRTRREQTLSNIGPFVASSAEPTRMIFINDPVAGVTYTLDPRTHVARKLPTLRFNFKPGIGALPEAFKDGGINIGSGRISMLTVPRSEASGNSAATRTGERLGVSPIPYPAAAQAAGVEGAVKLEVTINSAGEVETAKVIEGPPLLQQAVLDAVKKARFSARQTAAAPTKLWVSYIFALPNKSFVFVTNNKDDQASLNLLKPLPPLADGKQSQSLLQRLMPLASSRNTRTEQLGKQTIEGIEAEGKRTTYTIPAGEIGNERPIDVVSERWYSPELQVVVLSKNSDPRNGETVYRLTNINRSEPARSLFEVPSDYTIKENVAPDVLMRRKLKDKDK